MFDFLLFIIIMLFYMKLNVINIKENIPELALVAVVYDHGVQNEVKKALTCTWSVLFKP